MEASILKSTKKMLGLGEDYTAFDPELILFINSAFSSMSQLGVGPTASFTVDSYEKKWEELGLSDDALSLAKIYIYLKVRMLFDPPATSFLIESIEKMIQEHEWRLKELHDSTKAITYAPNVEESEVV